MSDVPSEILREILVRLPAESLFRFRSVCKAWLCMIDDPSFIKTHTNNQLYNHTHTLLVNNETGAPLYSFSLDSLNFMNNGPQMIDATPFEKLFWHDVPRIITDMDLLCLIPCNGLVLLSDYAKKNLVILNPLTKECRKLPKPVTTSGGFGFGFGYDPDSDDYKVVTVSESVFQTVIYSLKSDSWRRVEDCPCDIECNYGVYFDGVVYWRSERAIIALDLRTERYCQLSLPICVSGFRLRLDVLDGCLICTLNDQEKKTLDSWVMKDNGCGWIKLFSLEIYLAYPFLVAYLKRKGEVLVHHYHGFLWIDTENNLSKRFSVHGFPRISYSRIFPGSLVRLNGVGVVTATTTLPTKRKMNKREETTRLKVCVRNVGETCRSDYNYRSEDLCWHCKEE